MSLLIDGSTRVLGVVGDPVSQVRAPGVWTGLFRSNGVNAVCLPLHISSSDLASFFAGFRVLRNLQGLIATIPHKPQMLSLVDEATPRARQVGAVNVVAIAEDGAARGDILDGEGMVAALLAGGQTVSGRRALVVGAGGVGSAIAFALAHANAHEVAVSDIVPERAHQLARRLSTASYAARVSQADPNGFDLVINASPVGMRPDDPLPFDCSRLDPDAIVADVVIHPGLTPLLAAARERGCFVQSGALMSDYQVEKMAEFFGFGPGDWSPEAIAALKLS